MWNIESILITSWYENQFLSLSKTEEEFCLCLHFNFYHLKALPPLPFLLSEPKKWQKNSGSDIFWDFVRREGHFALSMPSPPPQKKRGGTPSTAKTFVRVGPHALLNHFSMAILHLTIQSSLPI